ncbi:sulfotransferase family 2 domain-containing protein [Marinicella meishanensis]|uniref:sulfotransferase family 2 domain-containing protein n=1 Tax=Marinicella meishanensis TaxID=2873263 RepID=UPI001CBC0B02|nr:sulfotransferase family 2 domain-containing protein [Marinicella sp. NBU2979]
MAISWSSNSDIENFLSNVEFLKKHLRTDTYNQSTDLICFSHVPKTAGSSLENILFKNHQAKDVLHINAPDLIRHPAALSMKKRPPKLVCGHHPMHGILYQLLPASPIFHVTMLRHPVDRVLSYYNYVLGKTDHPMHAHAKGQSLSEFLHALPSPELANGQSKRFSGYLHQGQANDDTLYDTAVATLVHCFSLVLTTELFDQSLLLLQFHLGLKDLHYTRSNVSTPFIKRGDLAKDEVALIEAMNQADLRLCDWAQKRCLAQFDQFVGTHALQAFQHRNAQWQSWFQ